MVLVISFFGALILSIVLTPLGVRAAWATGYLDHPEARKLHTAATANGVHGFRWFTVCAPVGWNPASDEWEVCPCGWRRELGKHYAKAGHVQWWREQIKERGSLEAVYRDIRKRQREYSDRDMG